MKSLISMRLGAEHHVKEKTMEQLIAAMDRNAGCADDVWLTTPWPFPSLEAHRASAEKMAAAADKLRASGYQITLQLASTIGHGWLGKTGDYSSFQSVMKCYDGTEEAGRSCPGDEKFLAYIYNMVSIYMTIKPDVIFIDDDLRLNINAYGCFCDRCMGDFNALYGTDFTARSLYEMIFTEPAWRDRWVDFGDIRLSRIVERVIDAAQVYRRDIRIGLQTVSSFAYNPYKHICDVVYRKTGAAPLIRAGGLAYKDQEPREMVKKAWDICYQRALLPEYIDDFRPELESFPHTIMNKTAKGFALEAALNLALSCNTVSVAAVVMNNEPMSLYENIFKKLAQTRPYFQLLSRLQDETEPCGIQILTAPLEIPRTPGVLTETTPADVFSKIEVGLPMSYLVKGEASPCYLSAEMARTMTPEEVQRLEERNLLTEARAVAILQERGLGGQFPVAIQKQELSEREYFSDHALNQGMEDATWYWPSTADVYSIRCEKECICCSYYEEDNAPATIVYENGKGKKVAIVGSINGEWPLNSSKRLQLLRITDYLRENGPYAFVETPSQTLCIPRMNKEKKLCAVTVMNESIAPAENLVLQIKNACGQKARLVGLETPETDVAVTDGKLTIPHIAAWDIVSILFQEQERSESI